MSTETFGYANTTWDYNLSLNNKVRYTIGKASSNGTLLKVHFYGTTTFDPGEKVRFGIYVSSTRTLLAQTDELEGIDSNGWISLDIGPSSVVADTQYIIAIWGDSGSSTVGSTLITAAFPDDGVTRMWERTPLDYTLSSNGNFSLLNPIDKFSATSIPSLMMPIYVEYTLLGGTEYTSYLCPIGSPLSWIWKSGQFGTNSGMRATSEDAVSWTWGVASSSVNYFYKAGTPTGWIWKSGSGT